jgi:CubicO group peptidase (beta-lactamase class C family)
MQALRAVSDWPVGSAAAVVVAATGGGPGGRPGAVTPATVACVGDPGRAFTWASVTKLCTALAVLVAAEEGTVSLDEDAGPPGSTVAHLLAHASGLGPLPGPPRTAPGHRRIYSNYGYEVLGAHVAARAGIPFATYLGEAVLEPLGCAGARWEVGSSPASGMAGTIGDLSALGRELLAPTLVAPQTLAGATAVAFPGLGGVLPGYGLQQPCDWGLGPEVRGAKVPHWTGTRNDPATFGHFGQAGGFLWVDPVAGIALGVLSDRDFGPWAAEAWPQLSDAVLAETAGR